MVLERGWGANVSKSDFKAVNAFQEIRSRYNKAALIYDEQTVVSDPSNAAVAADAEAMAADDDPMAALDAVVNAVQPKAKVQSKPNAKAKAKAKGAAKAKARSRVHTFQIPKHPECSGWDQEDPEGLVVIHVHKKSNKRE